MTSSRLAAFLVVLGVSMAHGVVLHAQERNRTAAGPLVTVHAERTQHFEVALDEVYLDWSRTPGAETRGLGRQATAPRGARIVESERQHARAVFPPVKDVAALLAMAVDLRAENPAADVYLVLYPPGQARSKATRRLLTREVGLLLEPGEQPQRVIAGLPVSDVRPVTGAQGGYVVDAADPIAALDLAEALRQRPGVRSAYPLLKRSVIKQ